MCRFPFLQANIRPPEAGKASSRAFSGNPQEIRMSAVRDARDRSRFPARTSSVSPMHASLFDFAKSVRVRRTTTTTGVEDEEKRGRTFCYSSYVIRRRTEQKLISAVVNLFLLPLAHRGGLHRSACSTKTRVCKRRYFPHVHDVCRWWSRPVCAAPHEAVSNDIA